MANRKWCPADWMDETPTPIDHARLEELRKKPSDAVTLARITAGCSTWRWPKPRRKPMPEPIEETISPWFPEQDRIRLAALGKLIEECNELAGRAARCIIQGLHEADPDTGRTNAAELEREMADVTACIDTAESVLGVHFSATRAAAKLRGFARWHDMIRGADQK